MLRTTLQTARPREAARLPAALRPAFRTQFLIPRTIAQRTFTTTRSTPTPKTTSFTFSSHPRIPPTILQRLRSSIRFFHKSKARRSGRTTSPDPTPNLNSPKGTSSGAAAEPEPQGLGAKMRKLSREYGWSALGVYFALTALDFPFCYLFVKQMGTDRIGEWEHIVISHVKAVIPDSVKQTWREWRTSMKQAEKGIPGGQQVGEGVEMAGWGVEEAQKQNKAEASLATQLALAYAIHKSFIFIRVPITVAITPKVVRILRGWGWDIGKRTTKEAKAIKRAAMPPKPKKA